MTRQESELLLNKLVQPKPISKVKHLKTGNMYYLLNNQVIECTNGREDIEYVLYMNTDGKLFCRERSEFSQKFEPVNEQN
jgi:hypothetical protein